MNKEEQIKPTQVIIKGRLPGENVDLFLKLTGELPTKANLPKQNLLFGAIDTAEQRGREEAIEEVKRVFVKQNTPGETKLILDSLIKPKSIK